MACARTSPLPGGEAFVGDDDEAREGAVCILDTLAIRARMESRAASLAAFIAAAAEPGSRDSGGCGGAGNNVAGEGADATVVDCSAPIPREILLAV